MRIRRLDLVVLGGLLLFAATFVIAATLLGRQGRTDYHLDPLPPPSPAEAELMERLGLLRPRFPGAVAWLDARGAAEAIPLPRDPADRAARLLLEGGPAAAEVVARQATAAHPDDVVSWLILGIVLEQGGRSEEARAALERAAALDAHDADVHYRLARLQLEAGRVTEAVRHAEQAVRAEPRRPDAQCVLGEALFAAGDMGRAKRAFRDVLQLRPDDALARLRVDQLDGTRR